MKLYWIITICLLINLSLNAQTYQFVNTKGELISKQKFSDFRYSQTTFLPVKKGDTWGILDIQKGLVIPCEYEEIQIDRAISDVFALKKDGKWGIMNTTTTILLPFEYDEIKYFDDEVAIVSIDFYWVLVNYKGEKLVDGDYENTSQLSNKEGIWFEKDNSWTLFGRDGKQLSQETFAYKDDFGKLRMVENGWHKTGAIDAQIGKIVVPLQYDKIKVVNDDLIEVAKCLIEYDGFGPFPRPSDFVYGIYSVSLQKEIVPCTFNKIEVSKEYIRAILVGYSKKSNYYNHQGKVLNPENIKPPTDLSRFEPMKVVSMSATTHAIQRQNRDWGILNYENEEVKWLSFPRGYFTEVKNLKVNDMFFPFVFFEGFSYTDIYDINGEMIHRTKYADLEKLDEISEKVTYKNYDPKKGIFTYLQLSKDGKITELSTYSKDDLVIPFPNADGKFGLKKADGTIVLPAEHKSIERKVIGENSTFIIRQ